MTAMRSSLVVAIITMSCAAAGAPTLLLALMVRDEEANLRANLPAFSGLADFVVCGIDDRSRDGSARAVAEALPDVPRWVFYFRFDGFGRGRTGVFREAWRKFPEASHVLVLDPDWELDAPRARPGTRAAARRAPSPRAGSAPDPRPSGSGRPRSAASRPRAAASGSTAP